MSSPGSITELIQRVRSGDGNAARVLCERYADRLRDLAHHRLPPQGLGIADEEDAAFNALAGFFLGMARGQFPQVEDRVDLWNLLVTLTKRAVFHLLEHEDADIRDRTRRQGACEDAMARAPDPRPPPDIQALHEEACQRLLDRLADATLQSIAVWKLEGYTDQEVAVMLRCTVRTVERKLRLIRTIWSQEERP
jgi:DNA-directed RNA polymerase specialized sigma24 family protein